MNLPNRLTIFRIVLVPLIILIYTFPYPSLGVEPQSYRIGTVNLSSINIVVLALYALASLTGILNEYIVRKRNMITTFGKFAKPIAEKLLTMSLFLLFAAKGIVPIVPVILMMASDIVVDGCTLAAAVNGKALFPGFTGRLRKVIQAQTILLVLVCNLPFELWGLPVAEISLWLGAFVSMSSCLQYYSQAKEDITESK